jgi:hypothetical protein
LAFLRYDLPESQEEVPAVIADIRQDLERILEEKRLADDALKIVQDFCNHPTTETRGGKKVCMVCCKVNV